MANTTLFRELEDDIYSSHFQINQLHPKQLKKEGKALPLNKNTKRNGFPVIQVAVPNCGKRNEISPFAFYLIAIFLSSPIWKEGIKAIVRRFEFSAYSAIWKKKTMYFRTSDPVSKFLSGVFLFRKQSIFFYKEFFQK